MDDSAVTRYDQYKTGSYVNTAMYMGTNSTSYYFSVANGNISRFFDEMYLNTPLGLSLQQPGRTEYPGSSCLGEIFCHQKKRIWVSAIRL